MDALGVGVGNGVGRSLTDDVSGKGSSRAGWDVASNIGGELNPRLLAKFARRIHFFFRGQTARGRNDPPQVLFRLAGQLQGLRNLFTGLVNLSNGKQALGKFVLHGDDGQRVPEDIV